jgi:hypothetical protein
MEEVSIKKAVVEIKVVRVGNKQMTKAVYNQIKKESIFDLEGNPKGEALGYIRGQGFRLSILWVGDGELRRFDMSDLVIDRLYEKGKIQYTTSLLTLDALSELVANLEQLFIAV